MFRNVCVFDVSRAVGIARFESVSAPQPHRTILCHYGRGLVTSISWARRCVPIRVVVQQGGFGRMGPPELKTWNEGTSDVPPEALKTVEGGYVRMFQNENRNDGRHAPVR